MFLVQGLAHAGPIAPPIVGGSETTAWPAVALLVGYDGDTIVPFCSAVLIGDRWALTAAHCLLESGADLQAAGYELWFRVGPSVFEAPGAFVPISAATTHPDYGDGPMDRGNDAAVVELGEAIDTPFLDVSKKAIEPSLVGTTITYVGYGLTGSLASDPGIARTVDATVSNVDEWVIETHDANRGPCDGDSGGPLLQDGVVIGLSSYIYTTGGADTVCEHGTAAGTRIDIVLPWIESIVEDLGTPGDTGPDDSGWMDDSGTGPDTGPTDSGAPIDTGTSGDTGSHGADAPAQLGCACGASSGPSGIAAFAIAAFASRRRRSRVPLA